MLTRRESFTDFSLRVLSALILLALLLALALLVRDLVRPKQPTTPAIPLVDVEPKPAPKDESATPAAPAKGEILLNPGQVYRCVIRGRTVFSDRPCPSQGPAEAPAKR